MLPATPPTHERAALDRHCGLGSGARHGSSASWWTRRRLRLKGFLSTFLAAVTARHERSPSEPCASVTPTDVMCVNVEPCQHSGAAPHQGRAAIAITTATCGRPCSTTRSRWPGPAAAPSRAGRDGCGQWAGARTPTVKHRSGRSAIKIHDRGVAFVGLLNQHIPHVATARAGQWLPRRGRGPHIRRTQAPRWPAAPQPGKY